MFLSEDHPLPINLAFSLSLGLLPVTLSIETMGCGIKGTGTHIEKQAGDVEHSSEFTYTPTYVLKCLTSKL